MPLLRLNDKNTSPNPHFHFISALSFRARSANYPTQQQAKQLLDALAAQVRPICRKHGFTINSFEEHNKVFLGRNWNAGETIEIVLRRSNGSFHDTQHLLQVLCHELAHVKHMNHGTDFQQLNNQLCQEVAVLRSKGYYGDGMFSSGLRLSDSAQVAGRGLEADNFDLPEYMCGGAQQRQRASTLRPRRRRDDPEGSRPKRRKPGTRVKSKYAFEGSGQALNSDIVDENEKRKGTGFRKSTHSAKERQARLEATEKRLKALRGEPTTSNPPTSKASSDEDTDSDRPGFDETDEFRRNLLSEAGAGWKFDSSPKLIPNSTHDDILSLISDEEPDQAPSLIKGADKSNPEAKNIKLKPTGINPKQSTLGLAGMVHNEVKHHKRERLGLLGERRLGGSNSSTAKSRLLNLHPVEQARSFPDQSKQPETSAAAKATGGEGLDEWTCLVCTCLNHNDYGVCQACVTPRGSSLPQE